MLTICVEVVAEQTLVVDVNEKRLLVEHTEVTIKQSKIKIRGSFQNMYAHFVCASIFSETLRVTRKKKTVV